jgi:integrase
MLLDAVLTDDKELERTAPLANEALVPGVRQQHRRHLREFTEWLRLHPTMAPLPLQESAVRYFSEVAPLRKWQWQTMFRSMTSFVGALSNLPLYSNLAHGIRLDRNAPHWVAALKSVGQHAQQSQPRGQSAVTLPALQTALDEEPRLWVQAALLLMWLTSARVGCVLQLEIRDVQVEEKTNELRVMFAHGKGVRLRGPYSRFARIEGPWLDTLQLYLRRRRQEGGSETAPLFPSTQECPLHRRTATMLASIRVADPGLNMRAMRRGSLQALSSGVDTTGATLEEVQEAAGHTNPRTTQRYLEWNSRNRHAAVTGTRITAALLPPPRPGPL